MLVSLGIRNYILIDSLDITFPAGLVIITGETGAGKSILLGALSLALGSRSDASMVGHGGDKCVVEAEFSCGGDATARRMVEDEGLDWNGGDLLVRRTLGSNGRSRSFINDEPVQVGVLQRLSPRLLDIHSQHQTSMLTDQGYQLEILDRFAGDEGLLEECGKSFRRMSAIRKELSEVRSRIAETAKGRDYNTAQYEELEKAGLAPSELEELETRQRQLANAEEIKQSLYGVSMLFSGTSDEGDGVDAKLKEAAKLLEKVGRFVPESSELAARLETARLEIDDIRSDVAALEASTTVSEDELARIEARMSFIYGLMNKHGRKSVEELISLRDELAAELSDTDTLSVKEGELAKALSEEERHHAALSEELHKRRVEASGKFSAEATRLIQGLDLDRAKFSMEFSSSTANETGRDGVTFMFTSDGASPGPLSRVASGGEKSRIMLSLKAMMARYAEMPAMVFDEIDTGVSGSAADKMGSLICKMGEDMQVFAITHLPQVAAKGSAHYVVSKELAEDGRAVSSIRAVTGEERVREIARILSGSTITPEAVANARVLLGVNDR